jgi:hypothetical protein
MYFAVKGSLKFNCFLVFLAYNILPSVHSPPDPHQKFVLVVLQGGSLSREHIRT